MLKDITWDLENNMRKMYPYMFRGKYNFLGVFYLWLWWAGRVVACKSYGK